jgi:mitochondrial fission protein ELM1
MRYLITERHPNTGRMNVVGGVVDACLENIKDSAPLDIERIFADGSEIDFEHRILRGFLNTDRLVDIKNPPGLFTQTIKSAAEILKQRTPELTSITSEDIPIFIACYGHPDAVLTALAIKYLYPQAILVSIGDPLRASNWFDIIAAFPYTLGLPHQLGNVLRLDTLPSRVTGDFLVQGLSTWAKTLLRDDAPLPLQEEYLISVYVGGNYPIFSADARAFEQVGEGLFTTDLAEKFCSQLLALRTRIARTRENVSFLITTSRRTPDDVADLMASRLSAHTRYFYNYNKGGPNPNAGYLAFGNAHCCTADSASMVAEAVTAAGIHSAPVYVFSDPGLIADPRDGLQYNRIHLESLARNNFVVVMDDGTEPIRRSAKQIHPPANTIAYALRQMVTSQPMPPAQKIRRRKLRSGAAPEVS